MIDIELEIKHVAFTFAISVLWLLASIWGNYIFNLYYAPIPQIISTFIRISFWIGGIGVGISVVLILLSLLE